MKYHHLILLAFVMLGTSMTGCVSRKTADGVTVGEAFGRFIAEGSNNQAGPLFGHGTDQSQ